MWDLSHGNDVTKGFLAQREEYDYIGQIRLLKDSVSLSYFGVYD